MHLARGHSLYDQPRCRSSGRAVSKVTTIRARRKHNAVLAVGQAAAPPSASNEAATAEPNAAAEVLRAATHAAASTSSSNNAGAAAEASIRVGRLKFKAPGRPPAWVSFLEDSCLPPDAEGAAPWEDTHSSSGADAHTPPAAAALTQPAAQLAHQQGEQPPALPAQSPQPLLHQQQGVGLASQQQQAHTEAPAMPGVEALMQLLGSSPSGPSALKMLSNARLVGRGMAALDGERCVAVLLWLAQDARWQQLQGPLRRQGRRVVQALLQRAHALLSARALTPSQLAQLPYVMGKLRERDGALALGAAQALATDLGLLAPGDLLRLVWGLAAVGTSPSSAWLGDFCKASQAKFAESGPPQLSLIPYSLARLGFRPPRPWLAAYWAVSAPLLSQFSAQGLANSVWALGRWTAQPPPGWLDAFWRASGALLARGGGAGGGAPGGGRGGPGGDSSSQGSGVCEAGAAAAGSGGVRASSGGPRAGAASAGGQAGRGCDAFNALGISQLQVGLAHMSNVRPPEAWLGQLLAAAVPLLGGMQPIQHCNLVWALAWWNYRPVGNTLAKVVASSTSWLHLATPLDLTNLLWALGRLRYVPPDDWMDAWLAASAAALPRCEPAHFATAALVLGRWRLKPGRPYMAAFLRTSAARMDRFKPSELSTMAWGLALLEHPAPAQWLDQLLDGFTACTAGSTDRTRPAPGDVGRLLRSLPSLAPPPGGPPAWAAQRRPQLQALLDAEAPRLAAYSGQELAAVALGLSRLGLFPGAAFMRAHSAAAAAAAAAGKVSKPEAQRLAAAYERLKALGVRAPGPGRGGGAC